MAFFLLGIFAGGILCHSAYSPNFSIAMPAVPQSLQTFSFHRHRGVLDHRLLFRGLQASKFTGPLPIPPLGSCRWACHQASPISPHRKNKPSPAPWARAKTLLIHGFPCLVTQALGLGIVPIKDLPARSMGHGPGRPHRTPWTVPRPGWSSARLIFTFFICFPPSWGASTGTLPPAPLPEYRDANHPVWRPVPLLYFSFYFSR